MRARKISPKNALPKNVAQKHAPKNPPHNNAPHAAPHRQASPPNPTLHLRRDVT